LLSEAIELPHLRHFLLSGGFNVPQAQRIGLVTAAGRKHINKVHLYSKKYLIFSYL